MTNSRFKFRVWDKKNKKMLPMHELGDFYIRLSSGGLYENWCGDDDDLHFVGDMFELIQSTGLYDCEGKEVFEGDILEYVEEENVFLVGVYWEDYSWILQSKPLKNGGIIRESVIQFEVGGKLVGCKIIGNRFENPEL